MTFSASGRVFRLVGVWLFLATFFGLGGCTHDVSDLRSWIAYQRSLKGKPLPPLPIIKTFETFKYEDQRLRDPFSPAPSEKVPSSGQHHGHSPNRNRPRQPLEMFPLDSLKMVGTIGRASHMQALIEDPDGVIHRVVANEYMGQNYGRVIAVGADHVDLIELVSDDNGGWIKHPASIALTLE